MPDRANVLKGLECCTRHECGKECPYHDIDTGCRTDMEIDALALLKEQDERIGMLTDQIDAITKWRANAGAFD